MHPALLALEKHFKPSPLDKIDEPLFVRHDVEVWIKRDDLLHPVVSGNKWRKLKYCLDQALSLGCTNVTSMGGPYSNHLHALAFIGKALGINTVGLIRGDRPEPLTSTLQDCRRWGMDLRFISRSQYRQLRQNPFPDPLPGQYWLPEGGAKDPALRGVAELVDELDIAYDTLVLPCGTGTTLAGCLAEVPESVFVLGIAALKNASFLSFDVEKLVPNTRRNWCINHDYHFGGFAQTTPSLTAFLEAFEARINIPLEPVYTGKMMYALYDLIAKGYFNQGSRIIVLHTGGLQGNRGLGETKKQQMTGPAGNSEKTIRTGTDGRPGTG